MSKSKKKTGKQKTAKQSQLHKPPAKPWLKYLLFLGLLACLVFLATQFFGNSSGSKGSKGKNLVSSYYAPMPLQLSETANIKQEFKDMAKLYNDKKYAEVIPVLNGFLSKKPDVKWNLYRGVAYYEMGELVKAEEDFKLLANSANIYLAEHGKWYQALSALQMGDNGLGKTLLQQLVDKPQGEYVKRAGELLSKL